MTRRTPLSPSFPRIVLLTLLACLAACAVGPNFQAPPAPTALDYTTQSIARTAAPVAAIAGGAQTLSPATPAPGGVVAPVPVSGA